ncbi:MAG: PepSY domain-containing protein [Methylophilaceae bacterium]
MRISHLKFNWMFWHRWLGMLTCVGILLWATSGISHPIMSRLQPKPVAFSAPTVQFDLSKSQFVKSVLTQHGISTVTHISLAQFAGTTYYRVSVDNALPARYFNVTNGAELVGGDALYASYLAQHFTGQDAENIANVELITAFSDDYHEVNRLLPVWRVEFSDSQHLRAYIDTEQSRLATLVNDTRYWLTQVFQFGHNWSFLKGTPVLQVTVAAIVLSAVLISALSGLYLYFKLGKAKQRLAGKPLRIWHRRLGLLVSLSALIFASSGLFHLIMSYQQHKDAITLAVEGVETDYLDNNVWREIVSKPLVKLDLINHDNHLYWYVLPFSAKSDNQMPISQVVALASETEHAEHANHTEMKEKISPYLRPAEGNVIKNTIKSIEDFAQAKALSLVPASSSEIESTTWITQFKNEYGFIFKRLPVIKVQMKDIDHTRYYIEPVTGALSAKVRDIDGLEGFVFAYLHKWSFNFINKDLRDILVSLFALANILVALMGFIMFYRKYTK